MSQSGASPAWLLAHHGSPTWLERFARSHAGFAGPSIISGAVIAGGILVLVRALVTTGALELLERAAVQARRATDGD